MENNIILEIEKSLQDEFKKIDETCLNNSLKVINAFHKHNVLSSDFYGTTGYGYGDIGRDKIDKIYAEIFQTESAIVRNQLISGTHALTVALFALLRPNDTLLSITGLPYETLHKVIGIIPDASSLKSFGINFKYIDLINNDFDYEKIKNNLEGVKVIHIQRGVGYDARDSISITKLEKVIKFIKNINKEIIILVDNCYCEFCSSTEPSTVGADITVGSLIKNLGGGIANNGAYIVGTKEYISLCAERLTSPGLGAEVGPSLGQNKNFLLGLYLAPQAVANSLKVKLLTIKLCEKFNLEVINKNTTDIVLGIVFKEKDLFIKYVRSIQKESAIDSSFLPEETNMAGYDNKIIMASGSFTDGSSIELSCDGKVKEPYIAYQQGSLTYEYGKIAIINTFKNLYKE
jgi:cystathionine beta-lyase family protein involved in aluminum resistance